MRFAENGLIQEKNQNDCKKRQNENQTEYNPESASDSFCIPPSLWNLFTLSFQNEAHLLAGKILPVFTRTMWNCSYNLSDSE